MADKSESGSLEIEQFVHFYKMLTQRDEVWKVFQDTSGDGEKLTLEELESFLRTEQQEGERSARLAQQLIDAYEPPDSGDDVSSQTVYRFRSLDENEKSPGGPAPSPSVQPRIRGPCRWRGSRCTCARRTAPYSNPSSRIYTRT